MGFNFFFCLFTQPHVASNTDKNLQLIHIWCKFTSKTLNYAKTKYIFLETK